MNKLKTTTCLDKYLQIFLIKIIKNNKQKIQNKIIFLIKRTDLNNKFCRVF